MARRMCNKLIIAPIWLSKSKAIWDFDGKQALSITHTIYPTMTMKDHRKMTTPLLITKLSQYQIILQKLWIKKHGAVLDMRNDWLFFWLEHYQYDLALRPRTAEPQTKPHIESHARSQAERQEKKQQTENPRVEKPHAIRPIIILKQPSSNKLPELLPYFFLAHKMLARLQAF